MSKDQKSMGRGERDPHISVFDRPELPSITSVFPQPLSLLLFTPFADVTQARGSRRLDISKNSLLLTTY